MPNLVENIYAGNENMPENPQNDSGRESKVNLEEFVLQ